MKKIIANIQIVLGLILILVGYGVIPVEDTESERQFIIASKMLVDSDYATQIKDDGIKRNISELIENAGASFENASRLRGIIILAGGFLVISALSVNYKNETIE